MITVLMPQKVSKYPFLSTAHRKGRFTIKLKNPMQSILGNSRKADVTFHASGRICISARVSKLLSLAHGDVVDIMEGTGETYLYVKHRAPVVGKHEGMVFRSNKNGSHCIASSIKLSRYILQRCSVSDKVRLCCGSPVTLAHYGTALPIIVKYIL